MKNMPLLSYPLSVAESTAESNRAVEAYDGGHHTVELLDGAYINHLRKIDVTPALPHGKAPDTERSQLLGRL
jgi:hypothetical protein